MNDRIMRVNDRIILDLLGTQNRIAAEINAISKDKTTPAAVGHWKKNREIPMKWRIYVQRLALEAGIIPPPGFLHGDQES